MVLKYLILLGADVENLGRAPSRNAVLDTCLVSLRDIRLLLLDLGVILVASGLSQV